MALFKKGKKAGKGKKKKGDDQGQYLQGGHIPQ